jgi:hypothetical protein
MTKIDKLFKILWIIIGFCLLLFVVISSIIFVYYIVINSTNDITGIPANENKENDDIKPKDSEITIGLTGKYKGIIFVELRSTLTRGTISGEKNKLYKREIYLHEPGTVNLYFHDLNLNEEYYLFEENKFIYKVNFPAKKEYSEEPFEYFIFVVIEKDTNQNGFLDNNDNKNLYISDYTGKNVEMITENMYDYGFTSNSEILITTMKSNVFIGLLYKFKEGEIQRVFEIQR